jgi:hypothetical protein
MMQENAMCFDEVRDATVVWREKNFVGIILQSCIICFQD